MRQSKQGFPAHGKNIIRHSAASRTFDAFNVSLMVLIIFLMVYPMYYMLCVSLSDGSYVMNNMVYFFPRGLTFDVYRSLIRHSMFINAYKNTIVYTVVGTVVNLTMSTLCAYPLSRQSFYGKGPLTVFVVFTMFFSGGLVPTYLMVLSYGLVDSMWGVLLPGAISTYNMIIMRTFFKNIPAEIHESAYLDGANDFVILLRIILPLSGAILATMTIFYAVAHWNSYFSALIYLNSREKYPVQLILRNIIIDSSDAEMLSATSASTSTTAVTLNYKYASVIITTLPILVIYPFLQKYFVKGVMIGSVKG